MDEKHSLDHMIGKENMLTAMEVLKTFKMLKIEVTTQFQEIEAQVWLNCVSLTMSIGMACYQEIDNTSY